jgi:hypothetical protein
MVILTHIIFIERVILIFPLYYTSFYGVDLIVKPSTEKAVKNVDDDKKALNKKPIESKKRHSLSMFNGTSINAKAEKRFENNSIKVTVL